MFPWMKEHITEAWNSRKSSRGAKKHSNGSSDRSRGMQATSESFIVRVISLEATVLCVPVTLEFTIDKVKSIATEHFYGHDKNKKSRQFRLIHSEQLKKLDDEKNLQDEEISESDELLLVQVRPLVEKENLSEEALKGPLDDEIIKATKDLFVRNPPKPAINSDCPADNEIRKILVTLVQTSAKILMHSPDAVKFYEIIKEKLQAQLQPPNDPKAVKYLVDMGFSERRALKALRLRKMNASEALEWLLEHQDDPDDEEDLQLSSLNSFLGDQVGPSSSGNEPKVQKERNLMYVVNLLLDTYKQHQKLDFKADPKLIESLEEMGFERPKIIETLKITGNNHANACAWLLGERRRSLKNSYKGMDPDGPIYSAIMNNPQIQLSLANPKMLLAYLSMLETPLSTSVWMKDPQVSPVLSQIFKTYHGEKHAIHVNRYNDDS
ncbi:ubiquitin-associated domain-containing protein 1 isoform X2 [Copidosoma floridanum]|uniref:ubiquitin-associated domain-containing protein 1 isoform X2 n=1 Tax=Copidosoma floridanum TaxID=29053 RepID=UPI0006C94BB1|nr:ubiquitin-associated domain-containing protein 1 isoform X2 [Copidosoma floridanum]